MYRLTYLWNIDFFIFDENNWSFFIREFFFFYKNIFYLWDNLVLIFNNNILYNYNNINFNGNFIKFNELVILSNYNKTNSLFILFNQLSIYLLNFYNIELNNFLINVNSFNINLFIYFNFFLSIIFIFLIIYYFLFNFYLDYSSVLESNRTIFTMLYEEFILIWVRFSSIKFESYEEAICIIIIWPWCIFLIFTHIFSPENNEIFFIFIEWGLPIIYGYLILLESIILFGSYFFIYLNGARGRKILIITLLEDIISFIILLARVTLQMVRGIICGLYHDFFRELIEYTVDTWESYWFYSNWQLPFFKNYYLIDCSFFFIDWYIISFTLLFIYIILFLQLLFLLIAVWLFCRCWFISTKITINKFKIYNFNIIREINLIKKKFTSIL